MDKADIINRYEASYLIARSTVTFGNLCRIAGLVAAGLIAFIGLLLTFIAVGSYRDYGVAFVVFLIVLTIGALVGASFYVFGLVLTALGQTLLATLDTAVNTSPFLTNEKKEQVIVPVR